MSLQCAILVLLALNLCSAYKFPIGGSASVATIARRSQSMRPLTSSRSNPNIIPQTGSRSSSSSSASLPEQQRSLVSTSRGRIGSITSLENVEIRPFADRQQHLAGLNAANLAEASRGTFSEGGNIDPNVHGFYARVRNAMRRYGSAAVVGSVIGVGAIEVKNSLFHGNNNVTEKSVGVATRNNVTQVNITETTTEDSEELANPL